MDLSRCWSPALGYDEYRGVTAVGAFFRGHWKRAGHGTHTLRWQSWPKNAKYLYVHQRVGEKKVSKVRAGDIVTIAGLENIAIGETLADLTESRSTRPSSKLKFRLCE